MMEDCRRILNPRRVPPENCGVTYLYFVLIAVSCHWLECNHTTYEVSRDWEIDSALLLLMGTVAAWVGDGKGTWTRISFFSTLTIGVHLPVCTYTPTSFFSHF